MRLREWFACNCLSYVRCVFEVKIIIGEGKKGREEKKFGTIEFDQFEVSSD